MSREEMGLEGWVLFPLLHNIWLFSTDKNHHSLLNRLEELIALLSCTATYIRTEKNLTWVGVNYRYSDSFIYSFLQLLYTHFMYICGCVPHIKQNLHDHVPALHTYML